MECERVERPGVMVDFVDRNGASVRQANPARSMRINPNDNSNHTLHARIKVIINVTFIYSTSFQGQARKDTPMTGRISFTAWC